MSIDKDPFVVPNGPITQSRAKKIKETMARLVQSTWVELAYSPSKDQHSRWALKRRNQP